MSRTAQAALPWVVLLGTSCLLSLLIPLSSAHWHYTLGSSGVVEVTSPNPLFQCTYTQGYWKNHPEEWPLDNIDLGSVTYTRDESIAILEAPPCCDATLILAHQLIAAKLNVANGADPSDAAETIADADTWLTAHPLGSQPPNPERQEALALAENLEGYNAGFTGPGHCDDEPLPPVPTGGFILESLDATAKDGGIAITWKTALEWQNVGFYLYRSDASQEEPQRLTDDLIPSTIPCSVLGAEYTYWDETAQPGVTYVYWLENVDVFDQSTRHGPVVVPSGVQHTVHLPLLGR